MLSCQGGQTKMIMEIYWMVTKSRNLGTRLKLERRLGEHLRQKATISGMLFITRMNRKPSSFVNLLNIYSDFKCRSFRLSKITSETAKKDYR